MAEHTLSLKATLDTTEVQKKLGQMQNQASNIETYSSETRVSLGKLSDALKNLKHSIGGMSLSNSLVDYVKSTKMVSDETTQMLDDLKGSLSKVMGAAMTGNIALVAFVSALEAFGLKAKELSRQEAEATKGLADLEDRVKKFSQFQQEVQNYRTQSRLANASQMSSDEQRELKGELQDEYSKLTAQMQEALSKGARLDAPETKGLTSRLKYLEGEIKKLDDTMRGKNVTYDYSPAHEESFSGYSGLMSDEDEQELEANYQKMKWQKSPSHLPLASDYATLLQQLGGSAMNGFSASGFGMGEISITTTISRQIDQVIRLLQDQLRKDLTVVNVSDNVI